MANNLDLARAVTGASISTTTTYIEATWLCTRQAHS
jgi:hypothetical protein